MKSDGKFTVHDLRRALRSDFEHGQRTHALSAAMIAHAYGKSPNSSWPYQLVDAECPFTLPMLEQWANMTGAGNLMQWIGRATNHLVAPIPQAETECTSTIPGLLREFADVIDSVNAALEDGRVSKDEAERVWREGEELIAAVYGVMLAAKAEAKRGRNGRAASLRALA